jgi:hypothetical protein
MNSVKKSKVYRPSAWKTRENPGAGSSTFDDCEFFQLSCHISDQERNIFNIALSPPSPSANQFDEAKSIIW